MKKKRENVKKDEPDLTNADSKPLMIRSRIGYRNISDERLGN